MEPVFIWQTEPTWLRPSAQQERMIASSSACSATWGYQSETQMPLWPYCFQVRCEGIRVFEAVPMAVTTRPKEAGIGWPASLSRVGFGSNKSTWLGPPSIKSQMIDFALGVWCGGFGASGLTTALGIAARARVSS